VDVVGLTVELGQLGFEIGTHGSHDLFHAGQVGVGEDPVPELCHENQMGVE
jgi:hypothetical protein